MHLAGQVRASSVCVRPALHEVHQHAASRRLCRRPLQGAFEDMQPSACRLVSCSVNAGNVQERYLMTTSSIGSPPGADLPELSLCLVKRSSTAVRDAGVGVRPAAAGVCLRAAAGRRGQGEGAPPGVHRQRPGAAEGGDPVPGLLRPRLRVPVSRRCRGAQDVS